MTTELEQVLAKAKALSVNERALLAHCLISSLEQQHDEDVDAAWMAVAEQRLVALESGQVQGVTWQSIKDKIKRAR